MANKYDSTLLPQDNTPQENQKAILDLLAKVNETAKSVETANETIVEATAAKNYWQLIFTDVVSSTSTAYTDIPGFSLSFTPKTENIKITALCIIGVGGAYGAWTRVVLNNTPVYLGKSEAGYNQDCSVTYYNGSADANCNKQGSVIGIFPCAKNTLNTVKLQWRLQQGIAYINTLGTNISGQIYSTRAASSLLVEEI